MTEAAAQVGRRTHLPEQPVHGLGTTGRVGRQELSEFFGKVEQDRTGLEHPQRRLHAVVEQGRDLRVGVDLDEAAGELLAFADANQPGVVLGAGMPERQQLFEEDGDLHAIGRGQGIQLQRLLAHGQGLVVGRAGQRTVDVGELAARRRVVLPDPRRDIGCLAHAMNLLVCSRGSCSGLARAVVKQGCWCFPGSLRHRLRG
ncbi:hypothetical protein D3C80_663890 [compost metagenome]